MRETYKRQRTAKTKDFELGCDTDCTLKSTSNKLICKFQQILKRKCAK